MRNCTCSTLCLWQKEMQKNVFVRYPFQGLWRHAFIWCVFKNVYRYTTKKNKKKRMYCVNKFMIHCVVLWETGCVTTGLAPDCLGFYSQRRNVFVLFVCFVFVLVIHCPLWEMQVAIPGLGTAATRAALPIPTSECSIFMCPNNGTWLTVLGIFNVCTDVDTCDCTWGL